MRKNLHFNKTFRKRKRKNNHPPCYINFHSKFPLLHMVRFPLLFLYILIFYSLYSVNVHVIYVKCVCRSEWAAHHTLVTVSSRGKKKRFFQTKINGETSVFWTFLRWKSVFFQGGPCVCVSIHNHPFSCVTQKTKTQMNQTGTARFTVVHQHVCALPYWKRLDRTSTRSYTHVP